MLPRSGRLRELLRLNRPFSHRDRLILRDHLALERTRLANERTFMAYIRSALYLVIGGLALIQLEGHGELEWVGITALALSGIFGAIGMVRFYTLRRQLDSYYKPLEDIPSEEIDRA
jgi:putative membrane protein